VIKPFSVRVFMNELFREMEVLAARYERKNIRLLKNIRFVVDFELKTDSYYLKKALLRLIDNALKFTPEGSVELGAERSKEGLVLYVNDTGIGVSSDDAQKIFEPFVQVDGSLTRSFGGSGLGLTIAKGIAEALNARLVFESALGKGSKFSLLFGSSLLIRN
ncbi:MAG TPA: ATP-binding protein, partial [Prolixibacteraceae bacterium]|nr:ATP-binding protein [Prolixibacteraceae bacterium]